MVPGVAACMVMPGNTRCSSQKTSAAKLAFGSCTRRSKKEPSMVTVFCNGKKGKKLARSCVCSSGRVGFPKGASAAHGTVLGLPATSIVLVLWVGDIHDGHQPLLTAEAALQPVTIHLGDDLQDVPLIEAQLSCLGGNVMAKSFHLAADKRRGERVSSPQETNPAEAEGPPWAQRSEENMPCFPRQPGSQMPRACRLQSWGGWMRKLHHCPKTSPVPQVHSRPGRAVPTTTHHVPGPAGWPRSTTHHGG